jgi:hypothetical protein
LPPGEYSLDASQPGFDTYHIAQLTLNVRDRQMLRLELKLAAAEGASIQVTAHAEATSSDAAQGISVDQNYVQNLPANGRNAESLVLMTPGITSAAGGRDGDGFNANGLHSNTNYYTLDGVSMNTPVGGGGGPGGPMGGGPPGTPSAGSSTEILSIDSMQENCRRSARTGRSQRRIRTYRLPSCCSGTGPGKNTSASSKC